jgi:hypothetical protein
MADLRVDDRVLADCELRLGRLHREFRYLDARRDHLHGVWGAGQVADAMDDFYDNWTHYRRRLITRIEAVGRQVATVRTTFHDVDRRLAGAGHP